MLVRRLTFAGSGFVFVEFTFRNLAKHECSREWFFFALPDEGKDVAVLKTRLICPRFFFALPVEGKAVTMQKNIVKRECSKPSHETSVLIKIVRFARVLIINCLKAS